MRIVFFGTPDFAAFSLERIINSGFNVVGVVTAPDKPAGRGQKLQQSAVKKVALSHDIPIAQPTNLKSESFSETLREWGPDLGVVIAFRMLPESVWNFPELGTVNLHGSLLPDYRGAAPIQHAIINGETKTGVTTFFLKHEIDTGDIIDQESISIEDNMNAGKLHDLLMDLGARLMVNTLNKIESHGSQTPVHPQKNFGISNKIAPKISRNFCELDLSKSTTDILNKIRGLAPYPGSWLKSPWGDMKIFEAKNSHHPIALGEFQIIEKSLLVGTSEGSIEVLSVQLPGKPRMHAIDVINGLANKF